MGLTKYHCSKCGYTWVPRTEYPAVCPVCKSRKWDDREKEHEEANYEKDNTED